MAIRVQLEAGRLEFYGVRDFYMLALGGVKASWLLPTLLLTM